MHLDESGKKPHTVAGVTAPTKARHWWGFLLILVLGGLSACASASVETGGDSPDSGDLAPPLSNDGGAPASPGDGGTEPLGLLPDGGDAARLPDGGWDDRYQPAPLGACVSGTVEVASLPDVNCLAGLLDGDRVVIANVEWPASGTTNPAYLPRRVTVKALRGDGSLQAGPIDLTTATDLASCTARPALAQLGGRYAVAFSRLSPSTSAGTTYPPAVAVLGHDLRFTVPTSTAGKHFVAPTGGTNSYAVKTFGLSLQATGSSTFRLGFAQERATSVPSGGGQVSFGNVVSTTSFSPGPGPGWGAFDLVLLRGTFGGQDWGLVEADDAVIAATGNAASNEVRVYPGREVTHPYGPTTFEPSVAGGVVVASGAGSALAGLSSSPGGGGDVATRSGATTVLQHVSAQGTLSALGSLAAGGKLYSSGGRRWLVGNSYSSTSKSSHLTVIAADDPTRELSTDIAPTQGLEVLAVDALSDRLRLLAFARDVPWGGLHPEPGRLAIVTWCR